MKLYITGGGTGGHVTPGIAIARYCQSKRPDIEVRFAGTSRGIESRLVPREGYPLDTIEIEGLRRSLKPKDMVHNLHTLQLTLTAVSKAKKLLKLHKPDCVVGCGGYASYPVVAAAQKMGIPTVLLEVNAYPGKVTKMLAPKADRVLVCFEEAKKLLGGGTHIYVTGAPVRGEIIFANRQKAREKLKLGNQKLVISFWGSMGALYMNRHMAGMMAQEAKEKVSYQHIHATGNAAYQWMPELVAQNGADLEKHPQLKLVEYIYDMADLMAAADLVICRAGAATIGELCALGKPSIMVPSPYVAENHQEKNARALEKAGACCVITEPECTPEKLLQLTKKLLQDDVRREKMGACAVQRATLNASEEIYRHILESVR